MSREGPHDHGGPSGGFSSLQVAEWWERMREAARAFRSDAQLAQWDRQGDAWTIDFACLLIDILYLFIKRLFSVETALCGGREGEGKKQFQRYLGGLGPCLSHSETLCWSLNLFLQSLSFLQGFPK